MGLLDDLKNQAASRLEQQQSTRDEKNRNMQAVHNALREAQRYLIEFSESLNSQSNGLRNLGRHHEMMMTLPRSRPAPKEVEYPTSPAPDARVGLLDDLKLLIKR